MAVSETRKASAIAVTVVLLGGTVTPFVPAFLAAREMKQFCGALATGAALQSIQAQAESRRYDVVEERGGWWRVEHPGSLGRAFCEVRIDAQGRLVEKALGD